MRFLANENFPRGAVEALRIEGHDTGWIRTDAPGATDEQVLGRARAEGRVLLTFDKDFGELVLRRGLPASHGVVLFRLFDISKVPPMGWIERSIPGGYGVVLDDVVAGLYANLSLRAILFFWS